MHLIRTLFHRAKEREKRKARVKALKEQGVELGPSRKKLKKNSMENSSCHLEVAIDCSFDDLMSDRVMFFFCF